MKVLVFGASGRTGVHVVDALHKHDIVAFRGDILDAEAVDKALAECDAVISVIGHVKGSDPLVQTKGMRNVVQTMEKHGVSKLVSLTGTGVRFPGDKITLIDRLLNFSIKLIDPKRIQDGIAHVDYLKTTNVDWTVVRVLKLTNGKDKANWQLSKNGPVMPFTPRAAVAKAIVQALTNPNLATSAPIIARK